MDRMNHLEFAQLLNELEKMNPFQLAFFLSTCCDEPKLSTYVIRLLNQKMKLQQKETMNQLAKEKAEFLKELSEVELRYKEVMSRSLKKNSSTF
jgi:23S rRNA maturation mini-RNase III